MPITEADVDAMKSRIMELEKLVGDIGKKLQAHPDSVALGNALTSAKDEITRLNLRIDVLEKPKAKPQGVTTDDSEDFDWL